MHGDLCSPRCFCMPRALLNCTSSVQRRPRKHASAPSRGCALLVRAGIFIPLLGTGAALGRLVGMAVQGALSHAGAQLTVSLPAYAARTLLSLASVHMPTQRPVRQDKFKPLNRMFPCSERPARAAVQPTLHDHAHVTYFVKTHVHSDG